MPMYDFYCSSCSCEFEDMVGPDEACPPCPNCGSTDTERLLSAANLKHGAKPFKAVSYTHRDVYKRQDKNSMENMPFGRL